MKPSTRIKELTREIAGDRTTDPEYNEAMLTAVLLYLDEQVAKPHCTNCGGELLSILTERCSHCGNEGYAEI